MILLVVCVCEGCAPVCCTFFGVVHNPLSPTQTPSPSASFLLWDIVLLAFFHSEAHSLFVIARRCVYSCFFICARFIHRCEQKCFLVFNCNVHFHLSMCFIPQ